MAADLDPEEQAFATLIASMEEVRRHAKAVGDVLKASEVDAWFRQHAVVIRAIRFQAEDAEWED